MVFLCLVGSIIFRASYSVLGGFYNRGSDGKKGALALNNVLIVFTVFIGWIISFLGNRQVDWSIALPYALPYGICYGVATIATIYALKSGPILLSTLFMQLSPILVTLYGFVAGWQVPTVWTWIALGLVCLTVWLCLYPGKTAITESSADGQENTLEQGNEGGRYESRATLKWLFSVLVVVLANVGCSVFLQEQQNAYDGRYGDFFMVIAMAVAFVICLAIFLKGDKSQTKEILKTVGHFPIVAGIFNVLQNAAAIYLIAPERGLPPSFIYPVMGVGGLIVTTIFSAFVFKEKMRWWQWIGVAVGMVATAILSM